MGCIDMTNSRSIAPILTSRPEIRIPCAKFPTLPICVRASPVNHLLPAVIAANGHRDFEAAAP